MYSICEDDVIKLTNSRSHFRAGNFHTVFTSMAARSSFLVRALKSVTCAADRHSLYSCKKMVFASSHDRYFTIDGVNVLCLAPEGSGFFSSVGKLLFLTVSETRKFPFTKKWQMPLSEFRNTYTWFQFPRSLNNVKEIFLKGARANNWGHYKWLSHLY